LANRNVEIEDGQKIVFCQSCGTKNLILDDVRIIEKNIDIRSYHRRENIDVARIEESENKLKAREAEAEAKIKIAELELKKAKKYEERGCLGGIIKLVKWCFAFIIIVILLIIIAYIGIIINDWRGQQNAISTNIIVEFMSGSVTATEITVGERRRIVGTQLPGTTQAHEFNLPVGTHTLRFSVGGTAGNIRFTVAETEHFHHFTLEEIQDGNRSRLDITLNGIISPEEAEHLLNRN